MQRKTFVALLLALALVPLAPAVTASHTGAYSRTPIEHDDQGRSVEPDFANTGVLGPAVANAVIDTNLDGVAVVDGALPPTPPGKSQDLAPGCTDDQGRQASGLCGLFTVGAGTWLGATATVVPPATVGVQGMTGNNAPGRFSTTKGTAVRVLDVIHHVQQNTAGSTYIEVNRKLDDTGARAVLVGVDPAFGSDIVAGGTAIWAWYGAWTDKNGNGVIDSLYDAPALTFPPAPANDEFMWYGNCRQFPDAPAPDSVGKFCAYDTEAAAAGQTRMLGFLFPGNHHSFCGGTVDPLFVSCGNFPADIPARQVIHFTGALGLPKPCADAVTGLGAACDTNLRTFDDTDEDFFADPLLGTQGSVAFDQEFNDRTGDPRRDVRQWVYGLGWTTYFYDQSILNSLVQVSTVGCKEDSSNANQVILGTCRFADVDKFSTFSPAAEQLLNQQLKPALRSSWVFFRDSYIPVSTTLDGLQNNRAADQSGVTGPLDDQVQNPGFAREPNDAADAYPAASRGVCGDSEATRNGWCNGYAAHQTAPHAFGDLQPVRALIVNRPVGAGGGCVLCVAGVFLTSGYAGEAPTGSPAPLLRAAGDYRNTMGPGQYLFGGVFGSWQDKAQTWEETVFDVNALGVVTNSYTRAADGWVGNIVNQTGTWYYRGYVDEACATDQGVGIKTYGACHPYLDGAITDPQFLATGDSAPHGEFQGDCSNVAGAAVVLTPADGVWTVPVFVWRNHFNGVDLANLQPTLINKIEDKTGSSAPIRLQAGCATLKGALAVADMLVLPLGNAGETLTTSVTVQVGLETVRDVDTYYG